MWIEWSRRRGQTGIYNTPPSFNWLGAPEIPHSEFFFRWDVLAPGTTSPQVFLFEWNVLASSAGLPTFLFAWNVLRPDPQFFFTWDVIQLALFDAASKDIQRPITDMTRDPTSTFTPTSWTVTGNLLIAAEMWSADLVGTDLYRTRTPHDRFSLFAGLVDEAGNRQLYPVLVNGIPNDRYLDAQAGKAKTSRVSGRDAMAYLLDGMYSMVYRHGPTPAIVAGSANLQEKNGLFLASEIAAEVVRSGGLRLAWQCPDYKIWNMFQAVGRPYDILRNLVRPFSQHVARYVDVISYANIVYVRQRQLVPRVDPGMVISAKDLRIDRLYARVFSMPKIGRVSLRGRKLAGPGGTTMPTTPPGGVPIPHDTILDLAGGGTAVIYASLPPAAEAILLPATGLGDDSGTVVMPDGSTLGVGKVVLTADVVVQRDDAAPWVVPSGGIVRPDGLLSYVGPGSTTIVVPPGYRTVINSDSTATRLHD